MPTLDYTPYGDEWKQEIKKWNKDLLIEQYRKALIEVQTLQSIINETIEKKSDGKVSESALSA